MVEIGVNNKQCFGKHLLSTNFFTQPTDRNQDNHS